MTLSARSHKAPLLDMSKIIMAGTSPRTSLSPFCPFVHFKKCWKEDVPKAVLRACSLLRLWTKPSALLTPSMLDTKHFYKGSNIPLAPRDGHQPRDLAGRRTRRSCFEFGS
ncbi:Uncharacterized protein HZ326_0588 [Fusarium oxysporum f. sp. albedinis]|nr:Uncharacterized protein HZ326_0588 [Fusarium oxysporum f. sp. albedinis]